MSKKEKKARKIKKILRKANRLLLAGGIGLLIAGWGILHYADIMRFFDRVLAVNIDTKEVDAYYDLLSGHKQAGKNLILDLGVRQKDDLKVALERLKGIMDLRDTHIDLAYYDHGRPALIESWSDDMTIYVSPEIKEKREQINLLTHELCHIYVWRLDKKVFGALDQEKLVDCSSVFLGLGVLALNGMTKEAKPLPGGGFETREKTFGYLKPEQFGYLLARYCDENGIKPETVRPHLNDAGRRYYDAGRAYLRKKTKKIDIPEPVLKAQSVIRGRLEILREKLAWAWGKLEPRWKEFCGWVTAQLNSAEPRY